METIYKIYKYPIAVTHEQTVTFPLGARIISVINQNETLVLYAIINPENTKSDTYHIRIIGTGHQIKKNIFDNGYEFLASVQQHEGNLVWHIFIRKEMLLKKE